MCARLANKEPWTKHKWIHPSVYVACGYIQESSLTPFHCFWDVVKNKNSLSIALQSQTPAHGHGCVIKVRRYVCAREREKKRSYIWIWGWWPRTAISRLLNGTIEGRLTINFICLNHTIIVVLRLQPFGLLLGIDMNRWREKGFLDLLQRKINKYFKFLTDQDEIICTGFW